MTAPAPDIDAPLTCAARRCPFIGPDRSSVVRLSFDELDVLRGTVTGQIAEVCWRNNPGRDDLEFGEWVEDTLAGEISDHERERLVRAVAASKLLERVSHDLCYGVDL